MLLVAHRGLLLDGLFQALDLRLEVGTLGGELNTTWASTFENFKVEIQNTSEISKYLKGAKYQNKTRYFGILKFCAKDFLQNLTFLPIFCMIFL